MTGAASGADGAVDLLVAGGGPVGLVTALLAHRAGLSTMVLEPRSGPIDKACGEGLMPAALALLRSLDIDPDGRDFFGIRYRDEHRAVDAGFRHGPGRGVRRTTLQATLSAAVEAAGIEVRTGRVQEIEQSAHHVRAAGVRARYLAAADGLHSPIARRLGLTASVRPDRRWGLRQHFSVEPWTDLVEVHWSARAEAYVTPVAQDLVGVAILSDRRAGFADHLAAFGDLRARLTEPADGVRGAGPLRHRTVRRVAGRVLLVGDAAGYVDALTGEGLATGWTAARALVDAVAADRPHRYERDWRRVTRRYRALTGGLLLAATHVRPVIVPAAAALPGGYAAIVRSLAR